MCVGERVVASLLSTSSKTTLKQKVLQKRDENPQRAKTGIHQSHCMII